MTFRLLRGYMRRRGSACSHAFSWGRHGRRSPILWWARFRVEMKTLDVEATVVFLKEHQEVKDSGGQLLEKFGASTAKGSRGQVSLSDLLLHRVLNILNRRVVCRYSCICPTQLALSQQERNRPSCPGARTRGIAKALQLSSRSFCKARSCMAAAAAAVWPDED